MWVTEYFSELLQLNFLKHIHGLPWWPSGKEPNCNVGDVGLIPRSGRSLGGGSGNPLQYFCLKNPMDRGTWQAIVQGLQRVEYDWAQHKHVHGLELTPKYWVGQKIRSCFSIISYGKTWTNLLVNPIFLPVLLEYLMQWIGKTNVFKRSFIALFIYIYAIDTEIPIMYQTLCLAWANK